MAGKMSRTRTWRPTNGFGFVEVKIKARLRQRNERHGEIILVLGGPICTENKENNNKATIPDWEVHHSEK